MGIQTGDERRSTCNSVRANRGGFSTLLVLHLRCLGYAPFLSLAKTRLAAFFNASPPSSPHEKLP